MSKGSTVVTEALAGTRGRGDTRAEDERLGEELMASEKVTRVLWVGVVVCYLCNKCACVVVVVRVVSV